MGNETEDFFEWVDSETEGVDSENEEVDNKFLPPDRKAYILRTPPMSTTVTEDPLGAPWDGTI